jgi:hypothetical protein
VLINEIESKTKEIEHKIDEKCDEIINQIKNISNDLKCKLNRNKDSLNK